MKPNETTDDVYILFWMEHRCSGELKLHYLDHGTDYAKLRDSIRCREFTTSPTKVVIFKMGELVYDSYVDHAGREICDD